MFKFLVVLFLSVSSSFAAAAASRDVPAGAREISLFGPLPKTNPQDEMARFKSTFVATSYGRVLEPVLHPESVYLALTHKCLHSAFYKTTECPTPFDHPTYFAGNQRLHTIHTGAQNRDESYRLRQGKFWVLEEGFSPSVMRLNILSHLGTLSKTEVELERSARNFPDLPGDQSLIGSAITLVVGKSLEDWSIQRELLSYYESTVRFWGPGIFISILKDSGSGLPPSLAKISMPPPFPELVADRHELIENMTRLLNDTFLQSSRFNGALLALSRKVSGKSQSMLLDFIGLHSPRREILDLSRKLDGLLTFFAEDRANLPKYISSLTLEEYQRLGCYIASEDLRFYILELVVKALEEKFNPDHPILKVTGEELILSEGVRRAEGREVPAAAAAASSTGSFEGGLSSTLTPLGARTGASSPSEFESIGLKDQMAKFYKSSPLFTPTANVLLAGAFVYHNRVPTVHETFLDNVRRWQIALGVFHVGSDVLGETSPAKWTKLRVRKEFQPRNFADNIVMSLGMCKANPPVDFTYHFSKEGFAALKNEAFINLALLTAVGPYLRKCISETSELLHFYKLSMIYWGPHICGDILEDPDAGMPKIDGASNTSSSWETQEPDLKSVEKLIGLIDSTYEEAKAFNGAIRDLTHVAYGEAPEMSIDFLGLYSPRKEIRDLSDDIENLLGLYQLDRKQLPEFLCKLPLKKFELLCCFFASELIKNSILKAGAEVIREGYVKPKLGKGQSVTEDLKDLTRGLAFSLYRSQNVPGASGEFVLPAGPEMRLGDGTVQCYESFPSAGAGADRSRALVFELGPRSLNTVPLEMLAKDPYHPVSNKTQTPTPTPARDRVRRGGSKVAQSTPALTAEELEAREKAADLAAAKLMKEELEKACREKRKKEEAQRKALEKAIQKAKQEEEKRKAHKAATPASAKAAPVDNSKVKNERERVAPGVASPSITLDLTGFERAGKNGRPVKAEVVKKEDTRSKSTARGASSGARADARAGGRTPRKADASKDHPLPVAAAAQGSIPEYPHLAFLERKAASPRFEAGKPETAVSIQSAKPATPASVTLVEAAPAETPVEETPARATETAPVEPVMASHPEVLETPVTLPEEPKAPADSAFASVPGEADSGDSSSVAESNSVHSDSVPSDPRSQVEDDDARDDDTRSGPSSVSSYSSTDEIKSNPEERTPQASLTEPALMPMAMVTPVMHVTATHLVLPGGIELRAFCPSLDLGYCVDLETLGRCCDLFKKEIKTTPKGSKVIEVGDKIITCHLHGEKYVVPIWPLKRTFPGLEIKDTAVVYTPASTPKINKP